MIFKAKTAVRLKADSQLLFIDSIDETTATAYCLCFGPVGPEGEARPYPLDSLRENVIRAPRLSDPHAELSSVRKAMCWIGLHSLQLKTFHDRPMIGDVDSLVCRHCGEIRLKG